MKNKRLYKIIKAISKMYNVPLYIAWKYKYFPQDIKYYKKYGNN